MARRLRIWRWLASGRLRGSYLGKRAGWRVPASEVGRILREDQRARDLMASRREPALRGEDGPTKWLEIYKVDPLAGWLAVWPTCQWRRYDCQSPTAYRLEIVGENRSFLLCREHMRETAIILGREPPPGFSDIGVGCGPGIHGLVSWALIWRLLQGLAQPVEYAGNVASAHIAASARTRHAHEWHPHEVALDQL